MGAKRNIARVVAIAVIVLGASLAAHAQALSPQPQPLLAPATSTICPAPTSVTRRTTTYSAVTEEPTAASFAHIPTGTRLPIALESRIRWSDLQDATVVRAYIHKPVALATGQTIPSGTLVVGHIIPIAGSQWLGLDAVKVVFDQIQLTNGTMLPIATKGPNELIFAPTTSVTYEPGETLELEITAPAQVAVRGSVL